MLREFSKCLELLGYDVPKEFVESRVKDAMYQWMGDQYGVAWRNIPSERIVLDMQGKCARAGLLVDPKMRAKNWAFTFTDAQLTRLHQCLRIFGWEADLRQISSQELTRVLVIWMSENLEPEDVAKPDFDILKAFLRGCTNAERNNRFAR